MGVSLITLASFIERPAGKSTCAALLSTWDYKVVKRLIGRPKSLFLIDWRNFQVENELLVIVQLKICVDLSRN